MIFLARRLGRTPTQRRAMFKTMVTQLLEHQRLRTTTSKAKELRKYADRIVALARSTDELSARRRARSLLRSDKAYRTLFSHELREQLREHRGGVTRIVRCGRRKGDAAEMAFIELVNNELPRLPPTINRTEPVKLHALDALVKMQRAQQQAQQQSSSSSSYQEPL